MSSGRSFTRGVGRWHGGAEVYDDGGAFAGMATDSRTVVQQDDESVTVDVSFEGPFSFSGQYSIADHGVHRHYQGPLNFGLAETLADGLVVADNYWPDVGLSQRFFLMVLADDATQLSFALLARGEQLRWSVVGEYHRLTDGGEPPAVAAPDSQEILIHRPGTWSGRLTRLDGDLRLIDEVAYAEQVDGDVAEAEVSSSGAGFVDDARYIVTRDASGGSTPPGQVVGSYSLSGGRALSGQFHHHAEGVRVWRREVVTRDGGRKGVVHTWCRGGQRIGVSHGVLDFAR